MKCPLLPEVFQEYQFCFSDHFPAQLAVHLQTGYCLALQVHAELHVLCKYMLNRMFLCDFYEENFKQHMQHLEYPVFLKLRAAYVLWQFLVS